jgi:hypothetical protein
MHRVAVLGLICVAVCGCSSARECVAPPARDRDTEAEVVRADTGEPLDEALVVPFTIDPQRHKNVLVLSGGGGYGAYGAGLLNGWAVCTDAGRARPRFDVVTGISTGALIATLAFLGTPEDDATLERTYTKVSRDDIYVKRSLWSVPFSDSLATLEPLEGLLREVVTPAIVERVAAEHAKGRRLFVGSVNLDTGATKVWDLTALAASGRADRVERYRLILRAAVAIPVLFDPGFIDGEMHVDGGTREQLFLRQVVVDTALAFERSRARLRAEGPGVPQVPDHPTIFVVVNGKIGVDPQCTRDGLLPIALRSVSLLLDESTVGGLFRVFSLARDLEMDFRVERIPGAIALKESADQFNHDDMVALFDEGFTHGRDGGRWEDRPPVAVDSPRKVDLIRRMRAAP